jgi:hypothetical protein
MYAAPSAEALEEAVKSNLGNATAARIPVIMMAAMTSIKVRPEGFKGLRIRGFKCLCFGTFT